MTGSRPPEVAEDPLGGLDESSAEERGRSAARELVATLRRPAPGSGRRAGTSNLADLAKASRRLRQITRPLTILTTGCEEAATISGLERIAVSALAHGSDGGLEVKATHGLDESADEIGRAAEVLLGEAEVTAMAAAAPLTVVGPSPSSEIGSIVGRPFLVVPVIHDGAVIGLLHGAHDDGREIDEVAVAGLTAFAALLGTLWYCAAVETSWHDHVRSVRRSVAESLDRLAVEPAEDLGPLDDDPGSGPERPVAAPRVADDLRGQPLTPREKVVVRQLLEGASNRDIADDLVVTVDTVKSHVKRILRKTGASNRAELIHRASRPSLPD